MSGKCFLFFFVVVLYISSLTVLPAIPPDPTEVTPPTLSPDSSATIPAFPEQPNIASCPLDIPEELYKEVTSACSYSGQINPTHCCPVLAASLYSAYSRTGLEKAIAKILESTSINMPLLPEDSETCVNSFEKALKNRGIQFMKLNDTCDFVYCYCGIRLHPLSCPDAFLVNSYGELVGDERVKRLEADCLSSNENVGCSNCLNSLYLLSNHRQENTSITKDRSNKMRMRECQMMGLTWLLNKSTSDYIHTVSTVLRALMMSKDASDPQSCTLPTDGLPLAVDSSEINYQSNATILQDSVYSYLLPFVLAYICFVSLF